MSARRARVVVTPRLREARHCDRGRHMIVYRALARLDRYALRVSRLNGRTTLTSAGMRREQELWNACLHWLWWSIRLAIWCP